jgi:hypothetical protein
VKPADAAAIAIPIKQRRARIGTPSLMEPGASYAKTLPVLGALLRNAMGFILFVGEVGRCSIALEAAPIAESRGANIPRSVVSQFE